MANVDLERAKKLINSAEDLLKSGEYSGVAGLAYQAFESAMIALAGDNDKPYHNKRVKLTKERLGKSSEEIDMLWELRNIDFYGNVKFGEPKTDINDDDVEKALNTVKDIVLNIENILEN